MKLRQLDPSIAIGGLKHHDVRTDAFEPHDAVHPVAPDRRLSFQLQSKVDEKLGCGRKVIHHNADVIHPLDCHVLDANESGFEATTSVAVKNAPAWRRLLVGQSVDGIFTSRFIGGINGAK